MVHATDKAPIESKVKAATAAAGITALVLQVLLSYVPFFKGVEPGSLAAVLEYIVTGALSALAAFIAGWRAKHTRRPDLEPPASTEGTGTASLF